MHRQEFAVDEILASTVLKAIRCLHIFETIRFVLSFS
jgi:hypothetical protein